jgi:hypothetical protein
MSTLIKRQVLALGLVVVLAAPAYSQAGSGSGSGSASGSAAGLGSVAGSTSARHIHFSHISINNDNDGTHRSYTLRATDADGNTYRFRKSDDRVVEFEINGKPVPRDQYAQYEKMFDELATPPTPPVPPVAPMGPAAPGGLAAPVAPVAPVGPAAPGGPVAPTAPMGSGPGGPMPSAAPVAPVVPATIAAPPTSPLPPTPPAPPEPPRANKYISRIIDELIDKGIIPDDVKLTFSLDNEALTVNGVKQPDEVFQAFRKKYIKHTGDHLSYEHSGSSSISSIKIEDDNH